MKESERTEKENERTENLIKLMRDKDLLIYFFKKEYGDKDASKILNIELVDFSDTMYLLQYHLEANFDDDKNYSDFRLLNILNSDVISYKRNCALNNLI